MPRPYSRSKLRHAAWCCPPLSLERLENRLALSIAPPFAGDFSGHAPSNLYSAGSTATLPADFGGAFDGQGNQVVLMGGSGGDRFDYSSRQLPIQDRGFDTLADRSAGFEPASQDHYSSELSGAPMQSGAPMANGPPTLTGAPMLDYFGASEQPIRPDPNFGTSYGATQITNTPIAPPGFLLVIVVTPSNAEQSDVEPNHVERPVDPPPEYAVRNDIVPVDSRAGRIGPAPAPAILPAELSHASQPVPSISLGADSLIRAQATIQAVQGSRAADLAPSAPQASQPMATPGDLSGNNGYAGLALSPGLDPRLPGEVPVQGDSQAGANLDQSGSNAKASGETRSNAVAVASASETESKDLAFLASGSTRGALLANLPFNVTAVDKALATMMAEVEGLGGNIAEWLEDSSVPPWAILATVVVTCGIGGWYYGYLRSSGSFREDSEEESSSWLFTQLENPAGQR